MSIEVTSATQAAEAPKAETVTEAPKSAPEAQASEQNAATESDTEETEEEERNQEAAEEESESEEETEESDVAEKEKPRKKGGFQRRIDKLNARYSQERQMREALEQRLAQLESAGKKPQAEKVETAPAEGKPDPDSFETHAEYVEALTDWKLEQRETAARMQAEKSAIETKQREVLKAHVERVQSFAQKTEDFQEVLSDVDDIPVSSAVQEIVLSSENGPELMYELAKNRDEYARICKLPPLAAARELGKIESKIVSRASAEPKPEPKKLTKAPKPLNPVGARGATASKSLSEMDYEEYKRARAEQLKSRK